MIGGLLKSASRVALFAAAGLFVGGVAMPSAKAADLGGDCCADLEERVAELEATTARKGNRRVSLVVSGQVNTAVMAWDQGLDNAIYIVDNGVSRSGLSFDGTAKINPNLTAGFQMVIALATGARSHQTTQFDDDGGAAGDGTLGVELANWFLRHDTFGEIRLGRINSASSGTTVVDLGGAGVIANANSQLWAGSFFITDGAIGGPFGGSTLSWANLMGGNTMGISGLSRQNAIMYTTPTWGGFSLSAAFGEQDAIRSGMWDVAARYAGEFSGFRVAAAVSYGRNAGSTTDFNDANPGLITDDPDARKLQGSASILHVASGLYLTGAYARQEYRGNTAGELNTFTGGGLVAGEQRPDSTMWYLQGGISQNWFGMGRTVLYGEYSRFDGGADGLTVSGDSVFNSEVSLWGVGVVQHIDAAAMELYLSYRQYSASFDSLAGGPFGTAGNMDDLSIVMGGARIRF
jgi:hypothetical protein